MHSLADIMNQALERRASDVLISANQPLAMRVNGRTVIQGNPITRQDAEELIRQLPTTDQDIRGLTDFARDLDSLSVRLRVSIAEDQYGPTAAVRLIKFDLPTSLELGVPSNLIDAVTAARPGLILISGPTDAGKSTTIASALYEAHMTRDLHTITIEDPVEHRIPALRGLINQYPTPRAELSERVLSTLRQVPDIIMIGEIRSAQDIQTALDAAESGHLVITTVHARSATDAISRVINALPNQQQAAQQLSMVLRMSIYQRLLPTTNDRRVLIHETLNASPKIASLIREMKYTSIRDSQDLTKLQTSLDKVRHRLSQDTLAEFNDLATA